MQSSSGLPSSRLSTVVIAVSIVLSLIGVGGIASGAADKPEAELAQTIGATTTTALDSATTVAGGAATTVAGGATATTAKTTGTTGGTTATTTSAACPTPPAATNDPGPHTPPAVGTYTYVDCADSSDTLDTKVTDGGSGSGVTRRNMSAGASGYDGTATLAWGPSGVLLESLTVASPQGNFKCDWNPDIVNFPAAMKVGAQWTTKSHCDLQPQRGAATSPGQMKADATGKVTGKVRYQVGNTTVDAWVIEAHVVLTIVAPGFGQFTITNDTTEYYDPAHGLAVFRHSTTSSERGGSETRDEKLVSLTPKS